MSKRPWRGVAALVPLALVVVACGSSPGASSGAASVPSPTAITAQASPSIIASAGATPSAGAASSSAAPAPASSAALDACAIFPFDLATQLAGVPMTRTVKGGGTTGSTCTYSAGSTFVAITLKRMPDDAAAGAAFTQLVADLTSAGGTGSVTPIQDIGDQAVELRTSGGSFTLAGVAAMKGSTLFTVETSATPLDTSLRHCAQTIAGQL